MPELPDVAVYTESLAAKLAGALLNRVRVLNPFVLRTAVPPIASAEGKRVVGIERLGKRVVIGLDGELFLVIHLTFSASSAFRRCASETFMPPNLAFQA